MANKFLIKRTATSGVTPNTTNVANSAYIAPGELAINMADKKLFTANTSGGLLELGSNLTNLSVTGTTTLTSLSANGSLGAAGQLLTSNGSAVYWSSAAARSAGVGLASNATHYFALANTGIVANATGLYVNSAYIATITVNSANNADYLDGQHGSFYAANSQLANYAPLAGATFSGAVTFNANVTLGAADHVILSSTSGISANGSYGTAGQVLYSNGSSVYWGAVSNTNTTYDLAAVANTAANAGRLRLTDSTNANDDVLFVGAGTTTVSSNATQITITTADQYVGTVTSVTGGAGLTGSVTTSGSLAVGAGVGITVNADDVAVSPGIGIVANSTGTHVNAAYIATVTVNNANNASYLQTKTWEAPGAIGSTTANTGAFTSLFASANLNVDNGVLFVDTVNNRVGIGNTAPAGEALDVRGNIRVGGEDAGPNYIAFRGTTGDNPGSYNHTYVGERIHTATEASELFLFKGNDPAASSGPDRVRIGAGEFRVDTYSTALSGSFEAVASNTTALTNKFIVASNGNVGIGNVTPGYTLTVSGTSDVSGNASFGQNVTITGNLTVSGTTTTVNTTNLDVKDAVIRLNSGQSTPLNDIGILMQRYATANSTNYNVGFAWDEGSDRLIFGATPEDGSDNDISFSTEWMTVTSGGRVGIGTTSPYGPLTTRGTSTQIVLDLNSATDGDYSAIAWNGSNVDVISQPTAEIRGYRTASGALGALAFHTRGGLATSVERMRIDSTGNVGIGTVSPAYKLDVAGAVQATDYRAPSANVFYLTGNEWRFRTTGGTERMGITSAGNLLVGTTIDFTSTTTPGGIVTTGLGIYPHPTYSSGAIANNTTNYSGLNQTFSFSGTDGASTQISYGLVSAPILNNSGAGGTSQTGIDGIRCAPVIDSTGPNARIYSRGGLFQAIRGSSNDTSAHVSNYIAGIQAAATHIPGVPNTIYTNNLLGAQFNSTNLSGNVGTSSGCSTTIQMGSATTSDTNTTTEASAFRNNAFTVGATSGGASIVTSGYGINLIGPTVANTGTMTNYYALYAGTPTVTGTGTLTNRYGVWIDDSLSTNYFAGSVGIGTSSPSHKLSVNGSMIISGDASFSQNAAVMGDLNVIGTTTLNAVSANGTLGYPGYVLASNGSTVYWTAQTGGGGSNVQITTYTYSIDANTNVITGLDDYNQSLVYTANLESVYVNGVKIVNGIDYSTTNPATITLAANAVSGDVVQIVAATSAPNLIVGQQSSAVASTTSNTVVDAFDKTVYRTAKYLVQIKANSQYHATEVLVMHDDTTAYLTEYATIFSNNDLGNVYANVNGSNVELIVSPLYTNSTINTVRLTLEV